jgi:hypothetical protein
VSDYPIDRVLLDERRQATSQEIAPHATEPDRDPVDLVGSFARCRIERQPRGYTNASRHVGARERLPSDLVGDK